MSKRIIEYDPYTGMTTSLDYHEQTDTAYIHREQDCQDLVDLATTVRNQPDAWSQGVKKGMAHYAIIPNIVIEKWLNDHGVNVYDKTHEKEVYRLLNKPEYRYLKTTTKMHWG